MNQMMQDEQQQHQQQQQRNRYGEVFSQARQALEDVRALPRGGRQPDKWLAPEAVSVKALKEFKNKVLSASASTNKRVDAALLAISLLGDTVRVEQEFRYKYAYLKSLRTDLDNHIDEVLDSRKQVRAAKRARRETDASRPYEVELREGDVGELSQEEDLR